MRITFDEVSDIILEATTESAKDWETLIKKVKQISLVALRVAEILANREDIELVSPPMTTRDLQQAQQIAVILEKIRSRSNDESDDLQAA